MFLVDENLPESLSVHLQRLGFSSVHVRGQELSSSPDETIWARAIEKELIVVSKDSDFIDMALCTDGARLLYLRVGNCSTSALKSVISDNLDQIKDFIHSDRKVLVLHGRKTPGE